MARKFPGTSPGAGAHGAAGAAGPAARARPIRGPMTSSASAARSRVLLSMTMASAGSVVVDVLQSNAGARGTPEHVPQPVHRDGDCDALPRPIREHRPLSDERAPACGPLPVGWREHGDEDRPVSGHLDEANPP